MNPNPKKRDVKVLLTQIYRSEESFLHVRSLRDPRLFNPETLGEFEFFRKLDSFVEFPRVERLFKGTGSVDGRLFI